MFLKKNTNAKYSADQTEFVEISLVCLFLHYYIRYKPAQFSFLCDLCNLVNQSLFSLNKMKLLTFSISP